MEERREPERREAPSSTLLGIIALILFGAVLHFAQDVLVLVVFALFLATLLQPLVTWLNRSLPNWASLSLALMVIGAFLVGVTFLLYVQAESVADKSPQYSERIERAIEGGARWLEELGIDIGTEGLTTEEAVTQLMKRMDIGATVNQVFNVVASGIGSVLGFGGQLLLVLIMTMFMLIEAPTLKRKLAVAFEAERREKVTRSMDSMTRQIQRYVTTKTVVSLVTGALTGVITHTLGVDFPVIWGLLAFQLNFVPHLGSIIAVFPPTLMALVQLDDISIAVATFLTLGSLQFTIGNIIEPRIMGRSLELSPLVVFISMVFWAWFWGVAGIVVAVPLTAAIRIICSHVDGLRPVALLLGNPREFKEPLAESTASG